MASFVAMSASDLRLSPWGVRDPIDDESSRAANALLVGPCVIPTAFGGRIALPAGVKTRLRVGIKPLLSGDNNDGDEFWVAVGWGSVSTVGETSFVAPRVVDAT